LRSKFEQVLRKGDYIGGSFVKPEVVDGYLRGFSPGDRDDELGRFSFSKSSVDAAVDCAVEARISWGREGQEVRATHITRFRAELLNHQNRCAQLLTRETGKPLWESSQEVVATLRCVDLMLEEGLMRLEPHVVHQHKARSDYRPRGVVGVLVPHVFPLMTSVQQTVAALLAGNCVVLKPSKFTPASGQFMAEMWDRCRLPRGVFNMVQGSGAVVGSRLVQHKGLDALCVSGSYATARAVAESLHGRPELPVLYHSGGKAAALVLDGADVEHAVYEVIVGAYLTAGQRHNSTARVVCVAGVYDAFVSAIQRRVENLRVGWGFDDDVFCGPVISEVYRTDVRRYGAELVREGHETLRAATDVEVPGRRGFYVSPSLHAIDWSSNKPFVKDEPPGPTLLVYKVDGWEEAVALHNQFRFRNQAAVFAGRGHTHLTEVVARIQTGALNINRGTIGASMRLPAVGLGRSSNGVSSGIELIRFMASPRATLVEERRFDPNDLVPGVAWEEEVDDLTSDELELDEG